ncbi:MAG: acyltransferase [Coxiellaceae bacterium]|nr:acyltransferase [Coxiellaceae bacterium]
MLKILKGSLSFILYALNLLGHAFIIVCIALVGFLIPIKKWKLTIQRDCLQKMPNSFNRFNAWIMCISTRGRWDVLGTGNLNENGWYLLISNHISWIDILVLGKVFRGKIPPVKFFMKKELLWQLPVGGLACYAMGYPFMSRHSHAEIKKNPSLKGKDVETTKKACRTLGKFPSTLINFSEGTRFTDKKKERQQSPYKHLLKPRAGGAAVVLHELHDNMSGILNVVIAYTPKTPTFWQFCCGNFDKIVVRYELLPITSDLIGDYDGDRNFRPKLQQWFNQLWERNDALIERVKTTGR